MCASPLEAAGAARVLPDPGATEDAPSGANATPGPAGAAATPGTSATPQPTPDTGAGVDLSLLDEAAGADVGSPSPPPPPGTQDAAATARCLADEFDRDLDMLLQADAVPAAPPTPCGAEGDDTTATTGTTTPPDATSDPAAVPEGVCAEPASPGRPVLSEEEIRLLRESARRKNGGVAGVTRASLPQELFPREMTVGAVGAAIERSAEILARFEYNMYGSTFDVDKRRAVPKLLSTADEILRDGVRIQCVEACFVGLLLTQRLLPVSRFGISFESRTPEGRCYRHLVLGLSFSDSFGSLGISRNPGLMSKPLRFPSLADMVEDFLSHYAKDSHTVVNVTFSKPIHHYGAHPVHWSYTSIAFAAGDAWREAVARYEVRLQKKNFPNVPPPPPGSGGARGRDRVASPSARGPMRCPTASPSRRGRGAAASPGSPAAAAPPAAPKALPAASDAAVETPAAKKQQQQQQQQGSSDGKPPSAAAAPSPGQGGSGTPTPKPRAGGRAAAASPSPARGGVRGGGVGQAASPQRLATPSPARSAKCGGGGGGGAVGVPSPARAGWAVTAQHAPPQQAAAAQGGRREAPSGGGASPGTPRAPKGGEGGGEAVAAAVRKPRVGAAGATQSSRAKSAAFAAPVAPSAGGGGAAVPAPASPRGRAAAAAAGGPATRGAGASPAPQHRGASLGRRPATSPAGAAAGSGGGGGGGVPKVASPRDPLTASVAKGGAKAPAPTPAPAPAPATLLGGAPAPASRHADPCSEVPRSASGSRTSHTPPAPPQQQKEKEMAPPPPGPASPLVIPCSDAPVPPAVAAAVPLCDARASGPSEQPPPPSASSPPGTSATAQRDAQHRYQQQQQQKRKHQRQQLVSPAPAAPTPATATATAAADAAPAPTSPPAAAAAQDPPAPATQAQPPRQQRRRASPMVRHAEEPHQAALAAASNDSLGHESSEGAQEADTTAPPQKDVVLREFLRDVRSPPPPTATLALPCETVVLLRCEAEARADIATHEFEKRQFATSLRKAEAESLSLLGGPAESRTNLVEKAGEMWRNVKTKREFKKEDAYTATQLRAYVREQARLDNDLRWQRRDPAAPPLLAERHCFPLETVLPAMSRATIAMLCGAEGSWGPAGLEFTTAARHVFIHRTAPPSAQQMQQHARALAGHWLRKPNAVHLEPQPDSRTPQQCWVVVRLRRPVRVYGVVVLSSGSTPRLAMLPAEGQQHGGGGGVPPATELCRAPHASAPCCELDGHHEAELDAHLFDLSGGGGGGGHIAVSLGPHHARSSGAPVVLQSVHLFVEEGEAGSGGGSGSPGVLVSACSSSGTGCERCTAYDDWL